MRGCISSLTRLSDGAYHRHTSPGEGPVYLQNYNPLGVGLLSILVAAVPILTLLYFIAIFVVRSRLLR